MTKTSARRHRRCEVGRGSLPPAWPTRAIELSGEGTNGRGGSAQITDRRFDGTDGDGELPNRRREIPRGRQEVIMHRSSLAVLQHSWGHAAHRPPPGNLTQGSCVWAAMYAIVDLRSVLGLTVPRAVAPSSLGRSAAALLRTVAVKEPTIAGAWLSFDAFYTAHHAPIARALSLTLGDNDLGNEATDEAMTRAYQRWSTVQTYDNPQGWVYRVGLNWARSFLRKRKRVQPSIYIQDIGVEDAPVKDPALARALTTLDDKQRAVVVLRYFLDWSVEDTAAALDVAPGTVKSRLHRALAQLQQQLADDETRAVHR